MAPVPPSPNNTAGVSPPPSASAVSPVLSLSVRILTFVSLLISVILLTTNTVWVTVLVANSFTSTTDYVDVKVKFNDFYAYRSVLFFFVFLAPKNKNILIFSIKKNSINYEN